MLRVNVAALALATALVATLAMPQLAHAQSAGYGSLARRASARNLAIGASATGQLTARDPLFADASHFQVWKFSARAGQDLAISLSSRDFGAFLMLFAAADAGEQPYQMAIGDSTGVAQLALRMPADGEYLLVVNTQAARTTGRYQVALRTIADACAAGGPCTVPGTVGGVTPIRQIPVATTPSIALGSSRDAELRDGDPLLADSSRFNAWRFDGRAGQRVVIDLTSSAFDTYLMLARQTPTGPALVRENDDAPGSRSENSQLAIELPDSGTYLIVATSFRPHASGRYQLRLRSMEDACAAGGPCAPAAPTTFYENVAAIPSPTIALGATVRARLDGRDGSIGDGTRFQAYRFRGNAGDEIAIFLDAAAPDAGRFDPFLHLLRRSGDSLAVLASDDDGGGQRNALVTARIPKSGEYFVVANGVSIADTGNFSLTVMTLADACARRQVCTIGAVRRFATPEAAVRAVPAETIALGATVNGRFDPGSARFPDGKPFAPWRYSARAGERVVITNRADDFDPYLYVYALRGDSAFEVARDDDGAGGLHAQIAVEFPRAGDYLIVAGSFATAAQGAYRLTLEAMDAACAAGGPCTPGETAASTARLLPALSGPSRDFPAQRELRGTLALETPRLQRGGRFLAYRFRGRANERVVLTMASVDFDAHLSLALLRGNGLRFVGSDDDGGSGTDARLVATLPETGEYLVVAAALASDSSGVGSFTLLRDRCDAACEAYRDVPGARSEALYQPALAAERRPVPATGLVDGVLTSNDTMLGDSTRFHAYRIEARRGMTIRAALHSRSFDSYLALLRVERNRLVLVATDDDGGGNRDALLEWPVEQPGTYLVLATAYSKDSLGAYTLMAEQGPAAGSEDFRSRAATTAVRPLLDQAMAAAPEPLAIGQSADGTFAVGSAELPGRGRFRAYRFSGRAGAPMLIDLTSAQFDAYLYLVRIDGANTRLLASDDDGGGGTNARISRTLPADGDYMVIAAEFDAGKRSAAVTYRLTLSREPDRR